MSGWRSKILNKKSDHKQNCQTSIKTNQTEYSANLPRPQHSLSATILFRNRNTTIQNDQTWELVKNQKQLVESLPNNLHLKSSVTSLRKQNKQELSNISSVTPTNDWEKALDREFQSLDIDADGYVSIADLQTVLKNFSHIYDANELLLRIFKQLDINNDKRISKEEFQLYKDILLERHKRFHLAPFEEKLTSIFSLFDRNHDNYITRQEIRETMNNLGENINDELIEEMMQTADTDHDGRISRDEFKNLLIELHSKRIK